MKLFGSKEATPMTQTGTDVLREALRARIHKGYAGLLARDLGIGVAALDEFAHGKGKLPDAIMSALAKNSTRARRNDPKRTSFRRQHCQLDDKI